MFNSSSLNNIPTYINLVIIRSLSHLLVDVANPTASYLSPPFCEAIFEYVGGGGGGGL